MKQEERDGINAEIGQAVKSLWDKADIWEAFDHWLEDKYNIQCGIYDDLPEGPEEEED